jgi:ribose-phosphate pyrophosphokinase
MTYLIATSAAHIKFADAACFYIDIDHFPSGEMRIRLPDEISGQDVRLIGSVLADGNSILELLMAAEGLHNRGCLVDLTILYMAYARQDKSSEKEIFAAKIICQILQIARADRVHVIDVHNTELQRFFAFENVIPAEIFRNAFSFLKAPVIVAPDKGALERADFIAKQWATDMAVMEKKRLGPGKSDVLRLQGNVRDRDVVIVDDIIDSGNTIMQAARVLRENGALAVFVGATHGVFSGNALDVLRESEIKKIVVTDTLPVHGKSNGIVEVFPIESELERISRRRIAKI